MAQSGFFMQHLEEESSKITVLHVLELDHTRMIAFC